jgi:hypothetical protein
MSRHPKTKKSYLATPNKANMATVTPQPSRSNPKTSQRSSSTLFTRDNHKWMAIGGALIILGFILMSGGKSSVEKFEPEKVYSHIRITVAPLLVLGGLGVLVYAIMKKPNTGA